jgi:PAS domain S-box-containing protein
MIALIAHSIIRYRLMNIRLVIRRGVAYLLAVTAASAVFVVSAIVASRLLFSPPELPPWVQLPLALLIALLFQPLKDRIQNLLNSYFFREPYDYQMAIREISRTMARTLDLNSLLESACDAIARTVRPESITIFTVDEVGSSYKQRVRRCSIETTDTEKSYAASAPIPLFLSSTKRHVVRHELSSRLASSNATLQDLRGAGAECALPIVEGDKVAGFFLLGPKLSGDPYFAEDLDLLTTLVGQAAIAIKNAQLYSQVLLVNEYVDNILTTMDSAVVAIAADGSVTLFNAGARRLTGLDVTDVRTMWLEQLPSSLTALLKATLHDSEPRIQIESLVQDSEGNSTPIICSTSPLKDRNGAVLGVVAVFSDLTRLKKLEEEKRQAERLASVGALASGLAHEIKNPLVAIKTFAELLPERFVDEDFRSDFSKVVITEIDRIDDLIARLRGLAAPQTQQLMPLDIRVPIDETIALLRGQLEQARIRVKTEYGPEVPIVAGDLPQLKQLFLNLFINSLESMASDGELTVRVSHRSTFAQRTVFVEIQDTGTGIPAAMLTKIFDPFVTTKQRGSGLGLSISRGIADAHRASIQARNRPSHSGALILIEFPALDPDSTTDVNYWPDLSHPAVAESGQTIRSTHPTR